MPKADNMCGDFQDLGYVFTLINCAKFNLLTGNKYSKK